MKYKVDDEVITKVTKGDVPSGTFGVVDSVEGKDIWVAVYIPADDDVPYDYIRYDEDQIEFLFQEPPLGGFLPCNRN